MLHRSIILIFLSVLIFPIDGISNDTNNTPLIFKQFTTDDGLPSARIYDSYQADNGLIWFATASGICYYDGKKIVNPAPEITTDILKIQEDEFGQIWFFSYLKGLFYLEGNKVLPHPQNEAILQLDPRFYLYLYYDDQQNMYLVSHLKNVIRINKYGTIDIIKEELFEEDINLFDGLTKSPNAYYQPLNDSLSIAISKHNEGRLYTNDGLVLPVPPFLNQVNSIRKDNENNVWISTRNGVLKYPSVVTDLNQDKEFYFKGKDISGVLQDNENGYWLTTLTEGIYYVPYWSMQKVALHPKGHFYVRNLKIVEGQLYAFEAKAKEEILYKIDSNNNIEAKKYEVATRSIEQFNHGLTIEIKRTGFREIAPNNKTALNNAYSGIKRTVRLDEQHWMMIGNQGFALMHRDSILYNPQISKEFNFKTYAALKNQQNDIYISAANGLHQLNKDYQLQSISTSPTIKGDIRGMANFGNYLLLGTSASGLLITDQHLNILQTINRKSGLSNNTINSIYIENDSIIWLATDAGADRIIVKNGQNKLDVQQIQNIYKGDKNTFTSVIQVIKFNKHYYFGTDNGLIKVAENELENIFQQNKIIFENISINDRDTVLIHEYNLTVDQRSVNITTQWVKFKSKKIDQYYYRLKGFDNDWQVTTQSQIQYRKLKGGHYTFEIKPFWQDEIYEDALLRVDLNIAKRYYEKLGFQLLAVLFSLMSIILLFLWILRRNRRQHEKEKLFINSRLTALVSQMNPHFIFNAMNSIQHFILKNDRMNAGIYLSRFSTLIRNILQQSDEQFISLEQEVENLRYYVDMEVLRFKDEFEVEFDTDTVQDLYDVKVPPMVIQPFIENAFKHGLSPKEGHKKLLIQFIKNANSIQCIVEDNGIGYQKNAKTKSSGHQSVGLSNTEKRKQLYSQMYEYEFDIEVVHLQSEGKAAGTKVIITFPLVD